MNTKTRELPENIQVAMTDYEAKKQAFIVSREKYSTLLTRLDKHKKTAQAARNESEQSSQTWRDLLRETDGALTKELTALRRQESDAKDLAQEFDNLIVEVEKNVLVSEVEAWDAWCEYIKARDFLIQLQDAYDFEQAKEVLLAMPEAKVIARAIAKINKFNYRELANTYGGAYMAAEQREYERLATAKSNSVLGDMFAALLDNQDNQCDVVETLDLESCHPLNTSKFSRLSPIRMVALRKELGMVAV